MPGFLYFQLLCFSLLVNPLLALFFGSNCGCQSTPCSAPPLCPTVPQCPPPPPCQCSGPSNFLPQTFSHSGSQYGPYQTSISSQSIQINPDSVQVQPVRPVQTAYINPNPVYNIAPRITGSSSLYADNQNVQPVGSYVQIDEQYNQRVNVIPADRPNEEYDFHQPGEQRQAIYNGNEGNLADNEYASTTRFSNEEKETSTVSTTHYEATNLNYESITQTTSTDSYQPQKINDNEYNVNTVKTPKYDQTASYQTTTAIPNYEGKPVQDNEYEGNREQPSSQGEYPPTTSATTPGQQPHEEPHYFPEPAQVFQENNYYETTLSSPTVVTPTTTIPSGFFSREEDDGYGGNSQNGNNNNEVQSVNTLPPGVEVGIIVPQNQIEVTASPKPDYDDDYVNPAFLGEAVTKTISKPIRSIQEHQRWKRSSDDKKCSHDKLRLLMKKIHSDDPQKATELLKTSLAKHLNLNVNVVCSTAEIVAVLKTNFYCHQALNNLYCLAFL